MKTSRLFLSISSLFIIASLVLSPFANVVAKQLAAPAASAADWNANGNYPFNWDYSAQTGVTASNVQNLAIKWVFPIPAPPSTYPGTSGQLHTPMIVKGIAYFVTNWHRVYALDASSGKTIWTKDLPILNITSSGFACSFPPKVPCGLPPGHYHNNAFVYTDKIGGKPLIWVSAVDY